MTVSDDRNYQSYRAKLKSKEQLIPFGIVVKSLYRLCIECRSGYLYIYTDEAHGAKLTLSQGNIVDIVYRKVRGMHALDKIRKINLARSIFKSDSSLRNRVPGDTVYLPANNVILSKLGMATSRMYSGLGSEIKKILVVDDSAMSRKAITSVFAGKSYEFVEAKDGLEALEKLQQEIPDLMLLDLILPKLDGYDVLNIMKKDNNYRKIPVIMLTSRDALFDKLKGKMSGTDEYLTKPISAQKLIHTVHKYLV